MERRRLGLGAKQALINDFCSIFPSTIGKNAALKHEDYTRLLSKYPPLKKLISVAEPLRYTIPIWQSLNDAVLYAVIGQMLSVSASASIINRLYKNLGSADDILKWAQKNCYKKGPVMGVSQRKRKALRAWSIYVAGSGGRWEKWKSMPLNEYRDEICSIWGFGRWSADMIAIFHLGRMDVWPETDAGIQKAGRLVFGAANPSAIKKMISGCETVAALYLWELLNKGLLHHFKDSEHG